jgi:hypothetical protein
MILGQVDRLLRCTVGGNLEIDVTARDNNAARFDRCEDGLRRGTNIKRKATPTWIMSQRLTEVTQLARLFEGRISIGAA